jgi:hypothetical protein
MPHKLRQYCSLHHEAFLFHFFSFLSNFSERPSRQVQNASIWNEPVVAKNTELAPTRQESEDHPGKWLPVLSIDHLRVAGLPRRLMGRHGEATGPHILLYYSCRIGVNKARKVAPVIKTDLTLQYCGVSKRRASMHTEREPVLKRAKMQQSPCRSCSSQNAVLPTKAAINNGPNMDGTFELQRKAARRAETWYFAETLEVPLSPPLRGEDRPHYEKPISMTKDESTKKTHSPQFAVAIPPPAAHNDGANTDPVMDTRLKGNYFCNHQPILLPKPAVDS